jgi:serine/threonine protein kinase
MGSPNFLGRIIDGKYQMIRELGRGGMGTVYLATHLGTERPVAVKIIAPQFMQRVEFVERFRREARAAGRLRHPNVVDVTDFGFAETEDGQVAYLVMEYLDGCTLGEVLDEEKNLPVGWTIDILEQVCSAVHEAHQQGIIHRDLKPDNIWLEPNQRGGYTVKVLDFGIAKLEEHEAQDLEGNGITKRVAEPTIYSGLATLSDLSPEGTQASGPPGTMISESETAVMSLPLEKPDAPATDDADQETIGTQMLNGDADITTGGSSFSLGRKANSSELTRVGAVLGTPLYMSPEQCRGEHLDPRSDIYSLGVIAYQMLAGRTPFEGDYKDVMAAHRNVEPPLLKAKGVRRKLRTAIHSAMSKDPESRPQTAEGFASELRARSEGLLGLLRRAMVIYGEHLPQFLALTAFFSIPTILLTLVLLFVTLLKNTGSISDSAGSVSVAVIAILLTITSAFVSYLNIGTITWIVTQHLAIPLRPLRLRPALRRAKDRWRSFAGTGIMATALTFLIGALTCGIAFPILSVVWALASPVVMMENLTMRRALRRSFDLVKRSVWTAAGAVMIMFVLPAMLAGAISFVVNITARALDPEASKSPIISINKGGADARPPADGAANAEQEDMAVNINLGNDTEITVPGKGGDMRSKVKHTLLESLIQVLWLPLQILVWSFSGIIIALLYVKTRLAGGETTEQLTEIFEDDGMPKKKWQERVRQRLIRSGRVNSKP